MSIANVQAFLQQTSTDLNLLAQVRAARGANPTITANNVVAIAAAAGFAFTSTEYSTEVDNEVTQVYQLLRAVPHFVLLAPTIP